MLAVIAPGDVIGWLAVAGVAVVAWVQWRGGGSTAMQSLKLTNEVLEARVRVLEDQERLDQAVISELRASHDFGEALRPLAIGLARHEQAAQTRHEATLPVLERIASKLEQEGRASE